ncbi:MAG: 3-hydroxyacyl-[acyl-carrier-protein] dehydratase, FabZ form (EC 4.2.1.59) [Olavius algarvensis Delta 4 endosymbiont]|nr:MAG: 3-hydroxyacyl-[acyl-carrier-protein] dehydratase, FabZ form (EC 4.2.1.59) [Olavius algarvensis Delta 4 endosymbiont]
MGKPIDIHKIMQHLPHRYPFLLVDRILDIVPGERITGLKNVTINEPFFQGHFPEMPIMPGVLIVEAMAQVGGVLIAETVDLKALGGLIYFMSIDKVRFRKPVQPGDQLIFDLEVLKIRSRAVKMAGRATVDDVLVAQGEFMAALGGKE